MELTIAITNKCNLHCDFCINQEDMRTNTKMVKELDILLEEHLEEYGEQYESFSITGGEPLIDETKLERVLSVLLSHSLEKQIVINTNGCYLTANMVGIFNQFDNIRLAISIDGVSLRERGLLKLLTEDYRDGYLTVSNILALKRKEVVIVLTRELLKEFNLALEIGLLSRYFNCPITLTIDSRPEELKEYNIDDVYNLGQLIYNLEIQNVYDNVLFKQFFNHPCKGHDYPTISWNGFKKNTCTHVSVNGCGKYQDMMKPGIYELMSKLINFNQFTFDSKIEDEPNYDANRGYVGERWEHQPKRKQLQYGERIAIRNI